LFALRTVYLQHGHMVACYTKDVTSPHVVLYLGSQRPVHYVHFASKCVESCSVVLREGLTAPQSEYAPNAKNKIS